MSINGIRTTRERSELLRGTDKEYEANYEGAINLKNSIATISVTAFGATRRKAIINCEIGLQAIIDRAEGDTQ